MTADPRNAGAYDERDRTIAQQAARIAALERQIAATDALMALEWDSADKVESYNLLRAVGAAPGCPATERPEEFGPVCVGKLARQCGLSRTQERKHRQTLLENGLFREHSWRDVVRDDDGELVLDERGQPQWRTHTCYAPPDGADWVATWGNPAQLGALVPGERMAKSREDQAEKVAEDRETARLAQAVLAQCGHCGAHDVDALTLLCGACGQSTAVADLQTPPAPATPERGRRPVRRTPRAPGHPQGRGASPQRHGNNVTTPDHSYGGNNVTMTPPEPSGGGGYTPGDHEDPLAAAVATLAPALTLFPRHGVMQRRDEDGDTKYKTFHHALTPPLIARHLEGRTTLSVGLCDPDPSTLSGMAGRAIAWDSDDDLAPLINGAMRVRQKGLRPLLVCNPSETSSGHLWLFFSGPTDPLVAQAAAEKIAPELAALRERFPSPQGSGRQPLRLPGGVYLPVGLPAVPVLVAEAPEVGQPAWVEGTTPAGWGLIARAVSDPAILGATWVPPESRYHPRPRVAQKRCPPLHAAEGSGSGNGNGNGGARARGGFDFAGWSAAHPVDSLVQVERNGMFKAPWRDERTASVQVYPDGHWHDFGPDRRHGLDTFDLWCAIEGYWNEQTNKPDRKAALRALRGGG